MGFLVAAAVVLFLLSGTALAYVGGAGAVLAFFAGGDARYLAVLPQRVFSQLDVFAFMAMPLFVLVGEIMNRGGITRALIDFSMSMVGGLKGGLGHVNIMTSLFFAGISGSAAADAAALSNTLVPAMCEKGYTREYAGAVTAVSSIIGPIIPPSIILILYGAIMGVDIAALFAAGIIPGIMLAVGLMATNAYYARVADLPGGRPEDMPPFLPSLKTAIPALSLPIIILSGIVFGIMTPTEAAGVAVVAALGVSLLYGTLTVDSIRESLRRTVILTGAIFVIIAAAAIIGYLVALAQLPQQLAVAVADFGFQGRAYLLLLTVVFLVLGMFVDLLIALALVVPVLVPAAIAGGADPVHVGLFVCLNLAIGMVTPPLGGVILVVSTITGANYWRLCRAVLPFLIVEIILLLIVVLFPEVTLYLPRALGLL